MSDCDTLKLRKMYDCPTWLDGDGLCIDKEDHGTCREHIKNGNCCYKHIMKICKKTCGLC